MMVEIFTNLMARYRSFIYVYLIQSYKISLELQLVSIHYWLEYLRGGKMIKSGTMWDQTDGCTKQYRCSIAYYMMSFLSKSYQIIFDRAVDKPGYGKDVVGGSMLFRNNT